MTATAALTEPTVYLVDDDPILCTLMESLFKGEGIPVETYSCAKTFLTAFNPDNPGCLLLDIAMPDMNGLQLQEKLNELGNTTPVIFLTGTSNVKMAVEALKAGAIDFLEKPTPPSAVLDSVRRAMSVDLESRYNHLVISQIEQRILLLTPRELEVMKLIVQGNPNKGAARILEISSRTVEVHRKRVFEKMQVDSVVDLATLLMQVKY